MATTQPPECLLIEQTIREEFAPGLEIECHKDFDTKDYIVWLTIGGRHHHVRLSDEAYQDDRWRPIVQAAIEEANR